MSKKDKCAQRKSQARWDVKGNKWVWLTPAEAAEWDAKNGQQQAQAFATAGAMA